MWPTGRGNERVYGKGSVIKLAVHPEPVTGPRSPGIVHRQSAINNKLAPKLAPKPTPKSHPNPTLTLP